MESSETTASYGPLDRVIVEFGGQCATTSVPGTGISVFNDAGTSFVEDSYTVRADVPATAGKTLFDLDLRNIDFNLIDY